VYLACRLFLLAAKNAKGREEEFLFFSHKGTRSYTKKKKKKNTKKVLATEATGDTEEKKIRSEEEKK